ncbi:MAG: VTT domain-containing protein [Lewinellaceae bacterium]|nr:VTT domain-containing protein [Lewinellaceae bacterium]
MEDIFAIFFETNEVLFSLVERYGAFTYLFLFLIIFCETGLVVTPFLPGDGLLFSAGILAASGKLEIWYAAPLLLSAAVLGNLSNYFIGKYLGDQLVHAKKIRLIRRSHILRTNKYYEKYGGRALVLGRFIPIIRTMVPFVAGIGRMNFRSFFLFTLIGGMAWTLPLTLGGYFFGDIQWVQENFLLIYLLLWVLTLGPLLWDVIWMRTRTMFAKRPYPRTRWLRRNGRSDQD